MTNQQREAIMARPVTTITKDVDNQTDTVTYIEQPYINKVKVDKKALQKLLNSNEPLPRVVVRCDRETGLWNLFQNDRAWKEMKACILANVAFSCEWLEGDSHSGCGRRSISGQYIGYASGSLLPIATPVTLPREGLTRLQFDPDTGKFYDPDSGEQLKGSGYLILKADCSSEYVNASVINPPEK